MGKHRGAPEAMPVDATPEDKAQEFDRYDAELMKDARPQTADERIEALQKLRTDNAVIKARFTRRK